MRASLFLIAPLTLWTGFVGASMYPTNPVEKSVLRGGTWNNITWRDTEASPSLDKLGKLRIDLWVDDSKHLATLAQDVDPNQRSHTVFIPSNLWEDASNFMILFKSNDPPATIYTANFAITNMNGNRSAYSEAKYRHPSSDSSNVSASATPSSAPTTTPGGGEDDMVTVTMEMSDSSAGASPTGNPAAAVAALTNNASSGGRHVRKSDIKFNIVFVLFPILFQLALSL